MVAWEHEYFYSNLPVTVSSPLFPGSSATIFGPNEGHDSAIVNAGAAVHAEWFGGAKTAFKMSKVTPRFTANEVLA